MRRRFGPPCTCGLSDLPPQDTGEIRVFTPKELSVYPQIQRRERKDSAINLDAERAAWFCHNSSPTDRPKWTPYLSASRYRSRDHVVQREMTVMGRLLTCLDADDK
jgi:hypothetical protein